MFETFLQQLINGLVLGMVYALIALGYTMVYGIIELINFAHGELFMVGAYFGLFFIAQTAKIDFLPLTLLLVFASGMFLSALLGVIIEYCAYRPLRKAPRLAPLIAAIGISFLLQNGVMLILGAEPKVFPALIPHKNINLGKAVITHTQVFIVLISILLMVFLHFFVRKTKLGKAMRASAQDLTMAGLVGININKTIALTFFIGSALGGAAGIMYGMYYGVIDFHMGYLAGLKAFTAAVLGGIGNIPGAMLGGVLVGLAEGLGAGYISSQWKDVLAFGILILVLIFKPSGLLGERSTRKT